MKKIYIFIILIYIINYNVKAQNEKEINFIKSFYKDYYNYLELDLKNESDKILKKINNKYLSKALIQSINQKSEDVGKYGYDPFLQGQDYIYNDLNTLVVKHVISLKFQICFNNCNKKIYFILKNENGNLKIYKVIDNYTTW